MTSYKGRISEPFPSVEAGQSEQKSVHFLTDAGNRRDPLPLQPSFNGGFNLLPAQFAAGKAAERQPSAAENSVERHAERIQIRTDIAGFPLHGFRGTVAPAAVVRRLARKANASEIAEQPFFPVGIEIGGLDVAVKQSLFLHSHEGEGNIAADFQRSAGVGRLFLKALQAVKEQENAPVLPVSFRKNAVAPQRHNVRAFPQHIARFDFPHGLLPYLAVPAAAIAFYDKSRISAALK